MEKNCACQRGGTSKTGGVFGPRNGSYVRKSDRKTRIRYRCRRCGRSFSGAERSVCFRQKKRHLNGEIWRRYCSSDPKRRIARDLGISRTTVARKITWLSHLKERQQARFLQALGSSQKIYLDELKTFIHTRCRPVNVSIAVNEHRKILGFEISRTVPNSQRLVEIHRKKYGPPRDESALGFRRLLEKLKPVCGTTSLLVSDAHPMYPRMIGKILGGCSHEVHPSRRAVVSGLGELKEKGYDPLFPINHTLAMIRAHVSRLVRMTWCTSKTIEGLKEHLNLYMVYHNTVLTP